jgi:hypothetical protein
MNQQSPIHKGISWNIHGIMDIYICITNMTNIHLFNGMWKQHSFIGWETLIVAPKSSAKATQHVTSKNPPTRYAIQVGSPSH